MNLTKEEKIVLRHIKNPESPLPVGFSKPILESILRSLEDKKLVKPTISKGQISGRLLPDGELLFYKNPKLRNSVTPEIIRWIIGTFFAAVAAGASIIAIIP